MHDYTLWYNKPADLNEWNEALALGNGILGMMVFGGIQTERIQFNEETIWSGYPDDNDSAETLEHLNEMRTLIFQKKYSEAQVLCEKYLICKNKSSKTESYGSYQTAGDLYIEQSDTSPDSYRRELNLHDGVAKTSFGSCERTYFVSYEYNTAVIKIANATDIRLKFERENCEIKYDSELITAEGKLPLEFAAAIKKVVSGNDTYIYMTAATNYNRSIDLMNYCIETLEKAINAGYETVYKKHVEYFSSVIDRVNIDLNADDKSYLPTNERLQAPEGDLGLVEQYFTFGRYLLISSSRGTLPANLQGIWCKDYKAPWSSDYHININIQMNYWFAEICNLPEFAEPFFRYIKYLSIPGKETAKTAYGCSGWVAHTITNPWGFTALGDHPSWGSFMCAGAWCCRHLWEHYLYTEDIEFLREYYPIIKGSSEFFVDFLVRDPNTGYLVTAPSNSPENSFIDPITGKAAAVCAAPTMDNSILYELFTITADAAKLLGIDSDYAEKVIAIRNQLPPIKIGKYGQIMEWQEDFDEREPGHRHMSQLYALHPAALITKSSTPELFEGAKKTLERRLAHGGGHTGWSRAWIINFFARLQDGNTSYENIKALIQKSTLPNMFDNHPPFQIDGNFGGTAGICEMLLQSHESCINILPALPDSWKDGSFSGLKARGGYTVSCEWHNGLATKCTVHSDSAKPVKAMINGKYYESNGDLII